MAYATRQDLEARFGPVEIENLDGDGSDPDRVAPVLADISAEIDGHLAVAYALPLPAGTYPLLTAIACDLARARLYTTSELLEPKKRRDSARAKLKRLAAGELQLVSAAGDVVERRNRASAEGSDAVMTADSLAGFR